MWSWLWYWRWWRRWIWWWWWRRWWLWWGGPLNLIVASRSFSTKRARDDTKKCSRILWLNSIYGVGDDDVDDDDDDDDYDTDEDEDEDDDDDDDLTWCQTWCLKVSDSTWCVCMTTFSASLLLSTIAHIRPFSTWCWRENKSRFIYNI